MDQIKPDIQKKPNQEILDHQRKRQVEVELTIWADEQKFPELEYASPYTSLNNTHLIFIGCLRKKLKG